MVQFTNANGISFVDNGVISQTIDVSGLSGPLVDFEITLTGLTHTAIGDLDFLLVAPDGTTGYAFWSDVGMTWQSLNETVHITDKAGNGPLFVGSINGTFLPTDRDEVETAADFGLGAVAVSHASTNGAATFASTFGSANLNGTWTLYVRDDTAGNSGSLAGWTLSILTPPAAGPDEIVPTDPLFVNQWNLRNFGQTGFGTGDLDLNVTQVWPDYTGDGVTIAVYDNGVQYDHPDLAANYDASKHVLINGVPSNAYYLQDAQVGGTTGFNALNGHGTGMAGIAAAANNGVGMVGVAYDATLVGAYFPIFNSNGSNPPTDLLLQGVQQLKTFDVGLFASGGLSFTAGATSANWLAFYDALNAAVVEGRGGLGTVLLNSVHNNGPGFGNYDNNASQWDSSRVFLHVGGVSDEGLVVANAGRSAAMHVSGFTAYSNLSARNITATDITGADGLSTGDYYSAGGTTSAVSQIAGVAALLLEANPNLGWRDVQSIFVDSARHTGSGIGSALVGTETDPWAFNGSSDWNGGGRHYSIDYGYGVVDALAAVRLAESWHVGFAARTSANETTVSKQISPATTALPDGTGASVTLTFDVTDNIAIEDVQLRLGISHSRLPQLTIVVTSPDGTASTIFHPMDSTQNTASLSPGWRYNSQEFRGEMTAGTWTVTITDTVAGNTGSITGASALVFYGSSDTTDQRLVFTDEYADYASIPGRNITNAPTGAHTLNAAAVTTGSIIDLNAGSTSTIAGQSLTIDNSTTVVNAVGGDGNDVMTGNPLDNELYGFRGNDTLTGGIGNDTLDGGANSDTADLSAATSAISFVLGAAGDGVVTATGIDTDTLSGIENLIGGSAGDTLIGNGVANSLSGNGGGDTLWGSYGADGVADTLIGGAGSDTYFVYETTDVVTETDALTATGGLDLVYSFSNRTLSANVEYLTLFGNNAALTSATGNDGDNALNAMQYTGGSGITFDDNIGNDIVFASYYADTINTGAGNDTLWGSWGADGFADAMSGGDGADTYYVQEALDTVIETNAGVGPGETDTVYSALNTTLGANLEYLFIYGSATQAIGNSLDNALIGSYSGLQLTFNGMGGSDQITGGGGNDTIDGGAAVDYLTGSGGADTFTFTAGEANGDYIIDFNGAGAGALDSLRFVGYGAGATFTQNSASQWQVNYNGGASTDIINIFNAAAIHATDYIFV